MLEKKPNPTWSPSSAAPPSNQRRTPEKRSYVKIIVTAGDFWILIAAFLSFLFSVYLWFSGDRNAGIFVGIWVPSILGAGIFFQNIRTLALKNQGKGRDNEY